MIEYKIFDLGITDDYIKELSSAELLQLSYEASWFVAEMEHELGELIGLDFGLTAPYSRHCYDQSAWFAEIDNNPSFAIKLGKAEELASLSGAARAINATAKIVLEQRIEPSRLPE